jgi:hypothetical protein
MPVKTIEVRRSRSVFHSPRGDDKRNVQRLDAVINEGQRRGWTVMNIAMTPQSEWAVYAKVTFQTS